MIDVTVKEDERLFTVCVGRKSVGYVIVFGLGGMSVYLHDEDCKNNRRYIPNYECAYTSLKSAANAVLRKAGYGNADDMVVYKVKGFRSR